MLFSKSLKKYYKKYAWAFIIGIVTLIAIDWIQLYIPDLLGELVKTLDVGYSPDAVYHDILMISLQVIGIAAGVALGRLIWRLTLFHASSGIEAGLRQEMFEKAERLSQDFYKRNKVGTILSWITTDTEEVQEFFGWGTVMLIDGIFLTLLVIVKMFLIDWGITLIILIPIILIVVWGFLVEKFMQKLWMNRQAATDKLYDFSEENFAGIRVIKSFVKENQQLHNFAKIARHCEKEEITFGRISVLFDVLIEIIIAVVVSLILGFGGYFVYLTVKGEPFVLFSHEIVLTADKLVVFLSYFMSLVWPLIALGQIITMRSRAKGSMIRIERFLDQNENITNCEDPIKLKNVTGQIEFKDLSFRYDDGDYDSLKNVSLKVNPGEIVGIVGRIGSGKSTLVNVLPRLMNVPEGTVFIDDVDIMKAEIHSLRNAIAIVPQDNFLFEASIEENIGFSFENEINKEQVVSSAEFSDVHKDISDFENKYDTFVGERGVTLSGGQKQRISISRAFLKDAPIMILDDSVSAVDVKTEEKILKNIKELRKGKTTLVVASRISTVSSLDRIIVLDDGKVEAFDTHKNLLKSSETYKKMVRLQELEAEIMGDK